MTELIIYFFFSIPDIAFQECEIKPIEICEIQQGAKS
jgi:hypothetical protein